MNERFFLHTLAQLLRAALQLVERRLGHRPSPIFGPSAPLQSVTLTQGPCTMTTATITDVLPTTRQDGSSLALTDIVSISFQKASLVGSPPVLGDPVVLQTNVAAAGIGLTDAQLTFADTTATVGDSYTSFVTDVLGHIGAASSPPFIVPATQSPPSAPLQSVTLS